VLKERRQVFDLPTPTPTVTGHRIVQASCTCGQVHRSEFPAGVAGPVQYGANIKALVVDLTRRQMMAVDHTAGLIRDLYRLPISTGTIMKGAGARPLRRVQLHCPVQRRPRARRLEA